MRASWTFALVVVAALALPARADTTAGAAPCRTAAWQAEVRRAPSTVAGIERLTNRFDFVAGTVADDACRGALFDIYFEKYHLTMSTLGEHIGISEAAQRPALTKSLPRVGWQVLNGDEGPYVTEQTDWLLRRVGARLPADWRDYLGLELIEHNEPFTDRKSLLIPRPALRERLLRWDDFLARHHLQSPLVNWAQSWRDGELTALVCGVDGAPIFVDGRLRDGVRAEIEAYLADPRAQRKDVVRQWRELLVQHDFRQFPEADAWIEQHLPIDRGEP